MIIMFVEIGNVRTVNGHNYRTITEVHDGFEFDIGEEVQTPRCGWQPVHICTRACDVDCKNAHELFDAIGIDY